MPAQTTQLKTYGEWAFLLGVVLAILVGLMSGVSAVTENLGSIYMVLGILGLIVGLLNISEKEVDSFLIAMIALAMTSNSLQYVVMGLNVAMIGDILANFLKALSAFVAPAAFVVAISAIWKLAKEK